MDLAILPTLPGLLMQGATYIADLSLQSLRDKKRPLIALMASVMVVICLALGGASLWLVWSSHEMRLREARVSTQNMALTLASQANTAIKIADVILDDIVERAEREGSTGLAGERLSMYLARQIRKVPAIHGLFVYDAQGVWNATSLGRQQTGNNADRDYFIFHKNNRQSTTLISAPVRSRSTGHWIIPVSRRLAHSDGTFAGVALATLRLDSFERFYNSLDLGDTGTVFFALENGTLIYRRPFQEKLIGTNLSSGAVFTSYHKTGRASTEMLVATVDGIERLYSYRRLDDFPVIVAAARSKQDIYAPWKIFSTQILLGALLSVAALIWFFRKLMRQIIIRDHVEAELRTASLELEKANAELKTIALKDGLTGLANRRSFDSALDYELKRARRGHQAVSLLMLDVDFFKKFNDAYGHVAGDDCLRAVAGAIAGSAVRAADTMARYGGEEFAVILPNTDNAGALTVAEAIRTAVMALGIAHAANPAGTVTVSIGTATATASAQDHGEPTSPACCTTPMRRCTSRKMTAATVSAPGWTAATEHNNVRSHQKLKTRFTL